MIRSLTVAFAAGVAVSLPAQSFNYTDFTSTAGLALLGNAAQTGTTLRLTANTNLQTGWAWRTAPVPVTAGFDTTFSFRITPPTVGNKGEGMALVIHDDPNGAATMGGTIWGMGYGNGSNGAVGIRNSIAIELDTWLDPFLSDTSANELTIHTRGSQGNHEHEQWSIARNTPATTLSNGQVHSLRVRYVPGTIEVFVNGSATPAISRAYSLQTGGQYANNTPAPGANLANGTAYVGFCSATGNGFTELCEITAWSWTSTPLAHPCYSGSFAADTLTVDGATGGFLRTVALATHQPFSIGIGSPPAFGPGAPYVLFASLVPQPGAFGSQLGFGETCFPVLPSGPAELVLADTFGLFPALLPAAPTPFTIALPPHLITAPLSITLQAVTLSSASPLALGVTNAIDVDFVVGAAPTIATVLPQSAAAGQPITITGTNFRPGCTLLINGTPAVPTSVSATQIVFPFPAGLTCGSQVAVVNLDGQNVSAGLNPNPNVTSTSLSTGPAAGGALFIVVGNGFAPGSTVTIGGAPANVVSASATVITMNTPPGTPGSQPVVITTPGGCVANTNYTYL